MYDFSTSSIKQELEAHREHTGLHLASFLIKITCASRKCRCKSASCYSTIRRSGSAGNSGSVLNSPRRRRAGNGGKRCFAATGSHHRG